MEMRRGFAGLLVLSVFMLGLVLMLSSHSPYIASKSYQSMVTAEIHSDRIAIARNVITKSYRGVDETGKAQWASSVADSLSKSYGLKAFIDFTKTPAEVCITDPSNGMNASFFLTS